MVHHFNETEIKLKLNFVSFQLTITETVLLLFRFTVCDGLKTPKITSWPSQRGDRCDRLDVQTSKVN
jgi:hypothetical protein